MTEVAETDGARRARDLLTQGDDEAAKQAYLDVLGSIRRIAVR